MLPKRRINLFVLIGIYAIALVLGAGATYYGMRYVSPNQLSKTAQASPLEAANMITGTVLWKDTTVPAADVRVVASDVKSRDVVAQASTNGDGKFMLMVGVGTWLVDIPTGDNYFGYGQLVTVLPHESYDLNFGITARQPDPPTPTAQPTNTVAPVQPGVTVTAGPKPATTAVAAKTPGVVLPKSGAGPGSGATLPLVLLVLAALFLATGICGNVIYVLGQRSAQEEQS